MTEMLKLSDKVLKQPQLNFLNEQLQTCLYQKKKKKNRKPQQRDKKSQQGNRRYKEEPNRTLELKNIITEI